MFTNRRRVVLPGLQYDLDFEERVRGRFTVAVYRFGYFEQRRLDVESKRIFNILVHSFRVPHPVLLNLQTQLIAEPEGESFRAD